jgi:hypothetical protein
LFAGLVWDATNDVQMVFRKASPRSVDFLVSAYKSGTTKHKIPYAKFETAIVDHLLKLDWSAIAARRSTASDLSKLVAAKAKEIASAKKALELWEKKFVVNPTEAMLNTYNSLQSRLSLLEGELARLEEESASRVASNATLADTNARGLATADRIQLRGYLATRIRQIRVAFGVPRAGWNKIEIELVNGVTVPLR